MNNIIIDVNACYKTIDENNVSAILEIKKDNSEFEMIFKYTFSIASLEKNSIEIYKDINIPELYNLYNILKDKPNYKGIFDIYFRVFQNDLNNLRSFAIGKMNEVNNPVEEEKEGMFDQVKEGTKRLLQEIWEEGSTDKRNGTIIKPAVYKKECPIEKIGEYANRNVIDILRYGNVFWENIYSHEYGKYKTGGILIDVNSVSIYKILEQSEIFKIISFLQTQEEYDVMKEYLKTVPKEPHGDIIDKKEEDNNKIENIKFL